MACENKDKLIDLIEAEGIPYIDNRSKNGCLWIIGDHSLDSFVEKCIEYGVSFRYYEKGARTAKGNPAWWTIDYLQCLPESDSCEKKLQTEITDGRPYWERFHVSIEVYEDVLVADQNYSVRLKNRVLRRGCKTVAQLLQESDETMCSVSGFGKKCLEELHAFFSEIGEADYINLTSTKLSVEFSSYLKRMVRNEPQIVDYDSLSCREKEAVQKIRRILNELGNDLVERLVTKDDEIEQIKKGLGDYANYQDLIESFSQKMLNTNAWMAIEGFQKCTLNKASHIDCTFLSLNKRLTLGGFIKEYCKLFGCDKELKNFREWCCKDLFSSRDRLLGLVCSKQRRLEVLECRASGKTLEETGELLGVTRERIRQIEKRGQEIIIENTEFKGMLYKVFFENDELYALSMTDVAKTIGEYGEVFCYIYENMTPEGFLYDKDSGLIIHGDASILEEAEAFVDEMPLSFPVTSYSDYIEQGCKKCQSKRSLIQLIGLSFEKGDTIYTRKKLSLNAMYTSILKNFYPNGFHIDDVSFKEFKQRVTDTFGIDINSKDNHAIGSVIMRKGILVDRGTYKSIEDREYIPDILVKKIDRYIADNEQPIVSASGVFEEFRDDLIKIGIDNRYYLQGVLKLKLSEKYYFRRDYISKDESLTNVYSSIQKYIRNSEHLVTKNDLKRAFPGTSDIVLNFAIDNDEILNMFGMYIHASKLRLSSGDKEYLKKLIESLLEETGNCYGRRVYDCVAVENPTLLANNFVGYPYSLFSLLEYCFRDEYQFNRPVISRLGVKVIDPVTRLSEAISEDDIRNIPEIYSLACYCGIQRKSIIQILEVCGGATHYILSNEETVRICDTGITEAIAKEVETEILNEISGTMYIRELKCFYHLPQIKMPWTDWLVYSVLKKYSKRLDVGMNLDVFTKATPLVARAGSLDVKGIDENKYRGTATAMNNDVEDYGSLIEEEISLDDF